MLLTEYINEIYFKLIPKKSFKFLDHVVIYVENRRVYKVLLRYTNRSNKQLRKLKIYNQLKFLTDPPKEILDDELIRNAKHERLMIIYDRKNNISKVYTGEGS
jgi:hypothetical protein